MPEQAKTASKNLGEQNSGIFKIVLHLIGQEQKKTKKENIFKWHSRSLSKE